MPLTTNQRNTVRTAFTNWATTNLPELTDSASRTAWANAALDYLDQHRAGAIASGDTQLRHYTSTIGRIVSSMGLSAAVITAVQNHCKGL